MLMYPDNPTAATVGLPGSCDEKRNVDVRIYSLLGTFCVVVGIVPPLTSAGVGFEFRLYSAVVLSRLGKRKRLGV